MNILFNTIFFVGFMVSEIPSVSVFGHSPYSVTFPYRILYILDTFIMYLYLLRKYCICNCIYYDFC